VAYHLRLIHGLVKNSVHKQFNPLYINYGANPGQEPRFISIVVDPL